jgi:hypothetical protein
MKPLTTGIAAALVSGMVMFTAGAKAAQFDSFTNSGALIQGADAQSTTSATALRPVATGPATAPISNQNVTRRRTVNRTTTAARQDRDTRIEEIRRDDDRSWGKSAMVIGGGAAAGAGVGGIVKGKKGALIGAAIGGGAASIYEATQRR